ncbi:hypothetical protein [Methylocapsa aurea]|uniref:hypothetical protein n=1 Tax=Methylocapsa aurea TaxID=663610 RepID=UPI000A78E5F8|nr:hypothetical protein [Methylocapsa aurea]
MNIIKSSAFAAAALLAATATAWGGPMSVASATLIAPRQTQIEQAHYWRGRRHHHHYHHHYRRYRHYGWDPGAAFAGAALGLFALPAIAATGSWCGPYYGSCYYGGPYYSGYYGWPYYSRPYYGYYRPYYRHYGWRPHYRHYAYRPYYRHYGGWHGPRFAGYGGRAYIGRSVGFGGWHGGGWHGGGGWRGGGGWHGGGGGWHGGRHR